MQKRTIFMMADGDMPFNGFCALSSLLKYEKRYKLVIICEKVKDIKGKMIKYGVSAEDVEILVYDCGILKKYIPKVTGKSQNINEENLHGRKQAGKLRSIYERKCKDMHYSMPYLIWRTAKELIRLKREEKIAKSIFSKYKPEILLLSTDRNIGLVQSMIYTAKIQNVPRVIAPTTSVALIENLMNMRYGKKECEVDVQHPDSKRFIEKINSDWVLEYKGEKYIFYQPWVAFAGWILRRVSLNPWIVGGGDATMVAVSRQEDYKELLRLCRDDSMKKKYILTQGVEDSLVRESFINRESVRKMIAEKYGIEEENIVIFALPQMYEHQMASWEVCRYNIIKIIDNIMSHNVCLLVSLHPKMERSMYSYLEKMERVHILDEALSSVIGIADLFVVLEECSTKKWAEQIGIDIVSFKVRDFCQIMDERVIKENVSITQSIRASEADKGCLEKDFCEVLEELLG